jgi:hypothetical protein
VVVAGGSAFIEGEINGNLVVFGGATHIAGTAVINGDVIGPGTVDQAPGAVVNGRIVSGLGATTDPRFANRLLQLGRGEADKRIFGLAGVFGSISLAILFVLLAVLIYTVWPNRVIVISDTIQVSWLPSLGAGLLTLLAFTIIFPILFIICIGIPVALVLAIGLFISLLAGSAALGLFVGARILRALNIVGSQTMTVAAGVGLLTLLAFIPCVGILAVIILSAISVGAALLTRFGTTPYPQAPSG